MKKLFSLFLAFSMVFALAGISLAMEVVPSIEQNSAPEPAGVSGSDGELYIAVVEDEDGDIIYDVPWDELVITPLSESEDAQDSEITERLNEAYEELEETETAADLVPDITEQLPSGYTAEQLVVTDLFDVSAYGACAEYLAASGNTVTVGFQTNIHSQQPIWAMCYFKDGWRLVECERDGDNVYFTLDEQPAVVAFVTVTDRDAETPDDQGGETGEETGPKSPKTEDQTLLYLVGGLVLLAAGAWLIVGTKKRI